MLLAACLCFSLYACRPIENGPDPYDTQTPSPGPEDTPAASDETSSIITEEPEDTDSPIIPKAPLDIETVGGVVIVGKIGFDDAGWYIAPEQPLNITYHYFYNNPSSFPEQTSIRMIDPKIDGIDKAVYLGQTVTVHGEFRFVRNDFETLYLSPFTISVGKIVEQCYGDSSLKAPESGIAHYEWKIYL